MDSIQDESGNARPKQWLDVCLMADRKVMEAQLEVKDAKLVVEKAENEHLKKKAELEKQLAFVDLEKRLAVVEERERVRTHFVAQLNAKEDELVVMREREQAAKEESAAKDLQIAKLQMQLELANERAKLRLEDRSDEARYQAKVQRVGQVKMQAKDTLFPKLISSKWSNEIQGVNYFSRLATSVDGEGGQQVRVDLPMPQLIADFANVMDDYEYADTLDTKHRAFGFCYKGLSLSESVMKKSAHIKEVYGVKVNDIHYVCIICFNRNGRRLSSVANLPYVNGLLPHSITVELVPGCAHHVSVYKTQTITDDPVLEMLKRPSMDKWFWHSAGMDA
jgi:hypothetical protein